MTEKQKKNLSKYISLILRHKPEVIGITLDSHGWAKVEELINGIELLTREVLEEIVEEDKKGRYAFNEDKTLIRANQGHSVEVDVELTEKIPPEILYHGSGLKYAEAIEVEGLKAGVRLYVHLSPDKETAFQVGQRHGKPVVYQIAAGQMAKDGYVFYQSVNGVWLTEKVPAGYLQKLD